MNQSRHLKQDQYHRIAVFRALKLGDMLCAVPALRALRAAFPHADISLVGLPWARAFVDRFPHLLDGFIEFPGHPAFPERDVDFERIPAFFEQMISARFDLAIQMHGSGSIINSVIALVGARETAGFCLPGAYCPDPDRFILYPEHEPEIWRHLNLMAHLGIPLLGDHLDFPLHEADRADLSQLARRHGIHLDRYVCVHPGASSCHKCWPADRFAAAADQLVQRGYQVVLTGSSAESDLTAEVQALMSEPAVDLAGKTSLGTLGALIDGAQLLLSNDTGVAHIAAALETPSVILFTSSEHHRWAPLNQELHRTVRDAASASPADVLAETSRLLEKGRLYAA